MPIEEIENVRTLISSWWYFLASVATLVGLSITVWHARRTRNAAETTSAAVNTVTVRLAEYDSSSACASAVSLIQEIRNYQQSKMWHLLPDRYMKLRNLIIQIRGGVGVHDQDTKGELQRALVQIISIAEIVEKTQGTPPADKQIAALNNKLALQGDRISSALVTIRANLGVNQ